MSSTTSSGKVSAPRSPVRRRARAVNGSVPGARPRPRSIRPGCSASSVANCSATTRGAWLGSMTPPAPTLSAGGGVGQVTDEDGRCRTGHRRHPVVLGHPHPSVAEALRPPTARRVVSASASAGVDPRVTVARSRTESGTMVCTTPGRVRTFPGPARAGPGSGAVRAAGWSAPRCGPASCPCSTWSWPEACPT